MRRLFLIVVAALACGQAPALTARARAAAVSTTESASPLNDPGSSYNYRSEVTGVTPSVPGLSLQVLEFADRLLLTNRTGRTITIYGYSGEPYARVLADGAAEVNVHSPAYYLNQNFYGQVVIPSGVSSSAAPKWEVLDRTGRFEWHDHRIHYMSPVVPPQVKDRSRLTLVFAWKVPIAVGATRGAVLGRLLWVPASSKASGAVIAIGVLIVLGGLAFVAIVRRRRRRAQAAPPATEAW
jgi:hypothetical protein